MAGEWIPMRCELANEPEVISIAAATGLDEDTVVGKLHRIWSWANQHTEDGNARSVTVLWIDRYLRCDGFAAAMMVERWLIQTDDGIQIPKFDRFNSQSAKRRALTAKRVADHKSKGNAQGNAQGNAASVTNALPKEEKRREYKKDNTPLPPKGESDSGMSVLETIEPPELRKAVTSWLAYKSERKERYKPQGLAALFSLVKNLAAEHGAQSVIAAIEVAMASGWKGFKHDLQSPRGSPTLKPLPQQKFTPWNPQVHK